MATAKYRVGDIVAFVRCSKDLCWRITACNLVKGDHDSFIYDLRSPKNDWAVAISEDKLCLATLTTTAD